MFALVSVTPVRSLSEVFPEDYTEELIQNCLVEVFNKTVGLRGLNLRPAIFQCR